MPLLVLSPDEEASPADVWLAVCRLRLVLSEARYLSVLFRFIGLKLSTSMNMIENVTRSAPLLGVLNLSDEIHREPLEQRRDGSFNQAAAWSLTGSCNDLVRMGCVLSISILGYQQVRAVDDASEGLTLPLKQFLY